MCMHPLLPFVEKLEASSLSRQLQQLQAQVEETADTGKAFSVEKKTTIGERIIVRNIMLRYFALVSWDVFDIYNVETSEVDMRQISANRHFSTGGPRSQHWRDPCGCIESLQFRGVVENRITPRSWLKIKASPWFNLFTKNSLMIIGVDDTIGPLGTNQIAGKFGIQIWIS